MGTYLSFITLYFVPYQAVGYANFSEAYTKALKSRVVVYAAYAKGKLVSNQGRA